MEERNTTSKARAQASMDQRLPPRVLMRIRHHLSLAVILLIFAVFLVLPIVAVLRVGFVGTSGGGFTFGYVAAVFKDPELRAGLINSGIIAILVTTLSLLISLPLAILSV